MLLSVASGVPNGTLLIILLQFYPPNVPTEHCMYANTFRLHTQNVIEQKNDIVLISEHQLYTKKIIKRCSSYEEFLASGILTTNSLPLPFSLTNSTVPFNRSTNVFTIARPRPFELSPAVGLALSFLNF